MALDIYWGLDIYRVVLFPLFESGVNKGGIQAVDEAAFEGYEVPGPVSFEFSFGNPRTIPNVSQGRVNDTIILPSTEAKTGVLRCSYDSQTLNALLTGVNIVTRGLSTVLPEGTDREGLEIQCAMLLQQLVSHDDDGAEMWSTEVCPRATLVPQPINKTDAALSKAYNIALGQATRYAWGETLTLGTHNCTRAVKAHVLSNGRFNMVGWLGDCVASNFTLPTDKPALTSSSATVWNFVTGAAVSGTWNATTSATTFTPTVVPDATDLLTCIYEW